jgi:hypothetical protein
VVAGFRLSSKTVWSPGHSSRTSSQTAILTGRLAPEVDGKCKAIAGESKARASGREIAAKRVGQLTQFVWWRLPE